MKNIEDIEEEIVSAIVSPKACREIRKAISINMGEEEFRGFVIKKAIELSESLKNFIEDEIILQIMSLLASKIHWNLIHWMNHKRMLERRDFIGWNNLQEGKIVAAKIKEIRRNFLDSSGKFRPGASGKDIDNSITILEQAAREVLEKIQKK